VVLVLTVLLQAGKGAGMGAAFGGSSGSVFGARGPATLIGKITCAAAVIFMCTSLFLAISQSGLKTESVMSDYAETPAAPADAPPAGQDAAENQAE
jgi:preprotein translocase subunit SecG